MATPDRIAVVTGPFLTGVVVEENTRTGSITRYTYEGSYTECNSKRLLVRTQGASEITLLPIGNGNWKLEAAFPYGENGYEAVPAPSVHELMVNISQRSPYVNPILSTKLTDTKKGIVARVVSYYQAGQYQASGATTVEAAAEAELNTLTSNDAVALRLFRLIAYRGVDHYIDYDTVYQRTLTAATPAQVKASYDGEGKIWTTAEVNNTEGLNPNGWFLLPVDMQWLKSPPHVTAIASQKTQVIYSYTACKQASALLYAPYGEAVLLDADVMV